MTEPEDPDKPGLDILERFLRPLTQAEMDRDRLAFLDAIGGKHAGETLVCLGTGPSISTLPRTAIERFTTIGCNGIGQVIQPDYYVIADPFIYGLHEDVFLACPGTRILSSFTRGTCDLRLYYRREDMVGLSRNCVYSADSTGYIILSIACVMGADRVLLAGYDGYPSGAATYHCYDEPDVEIERVRYEWDRLEGKEDELRVGYEHAARVAPSLGLSIELLTPSTLLGDLFPLIEA